MLAAVLETVRRGGAEKRRLRTDTLNGKPQNDGGFNSSVLMLEEYANNFREDPTQRLNAFDGF